MPPKTVRCSICGDEVMKARTYCVDAKTGQRACKTHEGVAQKKEKLQEDQAKVKEREKEAAEEKMKSWFATPDFKPKKMCFCCRKEGLHEQDWNLRFVVAREKVVQKYGEQYDQFVTMFTDDKEKQEEAAKLLRKEFNAGEDPDKLHKLNVLHDQPEDPKFKRLFRNTHKDAVPVVRLTGITMVCNKCLADCGITIEAPNIVNEMNFKHMMMFGAIIQDSIAEIAREEVRAEAERN